MDDFDNGWDRAAVLVDGRWVDRTPRRPEVAPRLLLEARLTAWLAPRLPVPISTPSVVQTDPMRVRHRLVPGEPCDGQDPWVGQQIGGLVRALHETDIAHARALGVPRDTLGGDSTEATLARMRRDVLPLLARCCVPAARELLARVGAPPAGEALLHGDLCPDHVRVVHEQGRSRLGGLIDWADACLGDAARDLAWLLHGTSPAFANAAARAYGVDTTAGKGTARRARDWYALAPWHQVLFGLGSSRPDLVAQGLLLAESRMPVHDGRAGKPRTDDWKDC